VSKVIWQEAALPNSNCHCVCTAIQCRFSYLATQTNPSSWQIQKTTTSAGSSPSSHPELCYNRLLHVLPQKVAFLCRDLVHPLVIRFLGLTQTCLPLNTSSVGSVS